MINPSLALRVAVCCPACAPVYPGRPQTHAQTAPKAIVLAWDGTVPSFVKELIREGKLPNLAKLIDGGASPTTSWPDFPSKTAPGFASLMTGAPPRVTGISGNRVPRAPREQFTILDSLAGFAGAPLRAEPIWATAERGGKKWWSRISRPSPSERAEDVVRFSGYTSDRRPRRHRHQARGEKRKRRALARSAGRATRRPSSSNLPSVNPVVRSC